MEMNNITLTIHCDTREKKRVTDRLQFLRPDINFVRKKLDSGDFTAMNLDEGGKNRYDGVVVERKAIADLDNCARNGTLEKQFDKLATTPNVIFVILVVGDLGRFVKNTKTQVYRPNADAAKLIKAVSAIASRYNAHLFWIENEDVAFHLMINFIESVNKGKYKVPGKRDYDNLSARVLGITFKQWIALKGDGNSYVDIANMSEAEMTKAKGIGVVTARKIKKVLTKGEKSGKKKKKTK